jgi:hypothetical protein
MKKSLSKLNKVDLREVWEHEAIDFTKWLADPENLSALSQEIGIEIKLIQTEASVGRFNVDVLAEEESSDRKIIIENQLEDTNHDHLGKIITYASGYDAEIVIWIAKDVRDEHKRAIDWLNEHTDEKINFFLIKIELWQIEDSKPAPKFDIIVSPNEWAKAVKTSTSNGVITNTKLLQLDFWTKFKEHALNKNNSLHLQTPRPQHWYDISIGNSSAHIVLTVNTREDLLGCELYISRNKELFTYLNDHKEQIESEIGEKLDWVDAAVASMIKLKKKVTDVLNPEESDKHFSWLIEETEIFQKVFRKYIKEFKK